MMLSGKRSTLHSPLSPGESVNCICLQPISPNLQPTAAVNLCVGCSLPVVPQVIPGALCVQVNT